MFINTIAVGPFDEVASCVTGGTTVAIVRGEPGERCGHRLHKHVVADLGRNDEAESLGTRGNGFRSDMATWEDAPLEHNIWIVFTGSLENSSFVSLYLRYLRTRGRR